jgi:two-component system sensor histidine kinase UhpB
MSLRLKINLMVSMLTLLFMAALVAQQFNDERQSVREEVVAANRVAAQLLDRMVWEYSSQGPQRLLSYLRGMGRVRSNDITLFDAKGQPLYHSPPSTYKSGRDAPDWFERLVSPPPSARAIRFPDGTLEIRANAGRAALDAWDEFVMLVGESLLLLGVSNATVFWLVGRAVRPLGRIVDALNTLEAGRFDVTLPPLRGTEAAAIGIAFNRMLGALQRNIENEQRATLAERQLGENRKLTRWIDGRLEQERRSIARELHDELGQSVTAIRSMALSIAQRSATVDAESRAAANVIADESSRLYDAMHGLIPRLTPLVLDKLGLEEALRDLVDRTGRSQPGLRIELHTAIGEQPPSSDAALTLYRAAQEGITNALRHGRATTLCVRLDAVDGGLTLDVVDDGSGLAPGWSAGEGHHGLRWLAERVEALGGRFALDPVQPHGVRLVVRVPLQEAVEAA